MVFFRKYRPQTIEELDTKLVRETLLAILSARETANNDPRLSSKRTRTTSSVPHAFLFTGPKGLGKTSTARIIAKILNCTAKKKKGDIEPCNKCGECVSITNGTNLDILEIDAASNRGIDEIRDLRDKVRLLPFSAAKKVYIIDEVHMLTTEAFNALLKTLEEPPPHVVFILCTTEPHKIPATIISRCTHIVFPLASEVDLVRSLKRVADREKFSIDSQALLSIARLSEGSFRDGAKILEELTAFAKNKKITQELINQRYNTAGISNSVSEIIEILSRKDAKKGIELISKMIEQGVDIKYFIEQLIGELHVQLLQEIGVKSSKFIHSTSSGQSSKLTIDDIRELMRLLMRAHGELKYAVLPQLSLEIAIIEWGQISKQPAGAEVANENFLVPHSQTARHANSKNFISSPRQDAPASPRSKKSDNVLEQLIEKIKPYNHSIAGVLRGCKLKNYEGKDMVIETGYKFHKDRLSEEKTAQLIEKVMQEIAGKKINVSVMLRG